MSAFQAQQWVEVFSTRELEVLQLISSGLSNREIARELYLSIETINMVQQTDVLEARGEKSYAGSQ